ncbi:MAG: glycyl-radical enzyme activating protein [Clostridia bacterium]|nr:glycyl-radical enzyme activating protein [Clostridia bacterium]
MSEATAMIFNIQRFSVDDGPGIRTTVFFKGCPLSCIWCHNPESHKREPELMYNAQKCIGCGACSAACGHGGHVFDENRAHTVDRTDCISCGACAGICPTKAVEMAGREETIGNILKEVLADKIFYDQSGGGMTVSGGEPLYQPTAVTALCKAAKEAGLHVAMETCGFASASVVTAAAEWVDLFLFDYKAPADVHESLTGVPQKPILDTLALLSMLGKQVILRCPIIPGCNDTDGHFDDIVALAKQYDNITEVHLEPYHPLGISKCEQLGRAVSYDNRTFLDAHTLQTRAEEMTRLAGKTVRTS